MSNGYEGRHRMETMPVSDAVSDLTAAQDTRKTVCVRCGYALRAGETFSCQNCQKGPMCLSHQDRGSEKCSYCGDKERLLDLKELERQAAALSMFNRLLVFLLLVCSGIILAERLAPVSSEVFLRGNVFTDHTWIWASVALLGVVACSGARGRLRSRISRLKASITYFA